MASLALDTLQELLHDAETAYATWEREVNRHFSGVDACRILMIHTYHLNMSSNLYHAHRYQCWIEEDTTGVLLETAMRGINLTLRVRSLRQAALKAIPP